tara:strand:- start:1414 stop:1809 length:396 start_codon:yes stop_codon:yes gene_type:complete
MAKKMIKRKDGSYSQRGLWDNIRANKGSGRAPTKEMLEQERKIKNTNKMGGKRKLYKKAGFPDNNNDGTITQADIFLQKKKTGTIKRKGGVKKKAAKKKMHMSEYMGGGMMKKMYKEGGFIEPPVSNIDDL